MPEFILDKGDIATARAFNQLDTFTQAYLEATFWTDCNPDSEDCADATLAEMAPEALKEAIETCAAFQRDHENLLAECFEKDGYGDSQAGHDFWLTRNHHGVGFWDRDLGSRGEALTKFADAYGETSIYRGDDGKLYFC